MVLNAQKSRQTLKYWTKHNSHYKRLNVFCALWNFWNCASDCRWSSDILRRGHYVYSFISWKFPHFLKVIIKRHMKHLDKLSISYSVLTFLFWNSGTYWRTHNVVKLMLLRQALQTNRAMLIVPPQCLHSSGKSTYKWLTYSCLSTLSWDRKNSTSFWLCTFRFQK